MRGANRKTPLPSTSPGVRCFVMQILLAACLAVREIRSREESSAEDSFIIRFKYE